jgi:hypothetical protein
MCAFSYKAVGFCPDTVPPLAKVAFVLSAPRQDDVTEQRPLSSSFGAFLRKAFIYDLGYTDADVAIIHVIRCQPPYSKGDPAYPTAFLRDAAEGACRQYDDTSSRGGSIIPEGLITWNPNLFIPTLGLGSVIDVAAFRRLIQVDVEKAWRFAEKGHRPCVLFGKEPMELVAKFLHGGPKNWRGHFYSGSWPFKAVPFKKTSVFQEV